MIRTTEASFVAEPSWRGRAFAALRFIAFAILSVAANFAILLLLDPLHRFLTLPEEHMLLEMVALVVVVFALTAIFSRMSNRTIGAYGYRGPHAVRNFAAGLVGGFVLLAAELLLMKALGCYAFGYAAPLGLSLAFSAILLAALFLAIGLTEETLFRGFALVELSRAMSFWPAAILLCVLFGIPHWLQGGGENFMGGVEAAVFGLAIAYSFRLTGSLWFAIGYHAAWDYSESFIFGTADSGMVSAGRFLHPVVSGPDWLSGGSVGPEGSILTVLPALAIVLIAWKLGRDRAAPV